MPFIQDMRTLIMKDCNLSDMAGSLIVESALRYKRLHKLDLKGMEMGTRFIQSLQRALHADPYCLEELCLSSLKLHISLAALIETIQASKNL
jgi:hypothetical protein